MDNIQKLRSWMEENKITTTMLAKELNISIAAVSKAMNPKYTNQSMPVWKAIKNYTGLDLEVEKQVIKQSEKNIKIPEYMEIMLRNYGSTIVGEKVYKRIGKNKLLNTFADKGLMCKIEVVTSIDGTVYHYIKVIA